MIKTFNNNFLTKNERGVQFIFIFYLIIFCNTLFAKNAVFLLDSNVLKVNKDQIYIGVSYKDKFGNAIANDLKNQENNILVAENGTFAKLILILDSTFYEVKEIYIRPEVNYQINMVENKLVFISPHEIQPVLNEIADTQKMLDSSLSQKYYQIEKYKQLIDSTLKLYAVQNEIVRQHQKSKNISNEDALLLIRYMKIALLQKVFVNFDECSTLKFSGDFFQTTISNELLHFYELINDLIPEADSNEHLARTIHNIANMFYIKNKAVSLLDKERVLHKLGNQSFYNMASSYLLYNQASSTSDEKAVFKNYFKNCDSEALKMEVFKKNAQKTELKVVFKESKTICANFTGGKPFYLSTFLEKAKGNYVLLDFWASWCSECLEELENIGQINDRFPNLKIALINVNDTPVGRNKIFNKLRLDQFKVENIYVENLDEPSFKLLAGNTLPRYVIIDPHGNVLDFNINKPSSSEFAEKYKSFSKN